MTKTELTKATALAGVAKQRHYASNQRLTHVSYQAFLIDAEHRNEVAYRIPCDHAHRTTGAATKCAQKLYDELPG